MALRQTDWQRHEFIRNNPVTVAIIGLWLLTFLLSFVIPGLSLALAFNPETLPFSLIGLVTHPLVMGPNILGLLIDGYVMWMFGGSLERGWGSRTFALFLLAVNLISSIVWIAGVWLVTRHLVFLAYPWLMLAPVIVAWAFSYAEETILFMFVLPLKAKWVGWITIAGIFFFLPMSVVGTSPFVLVLGFFALGGVGAAYLYTYYRRQWGWIPRTPRRKKAPLPRNVTRHPSSSLWGQVTRPWREWQRRRRIAHLQKTIRFDD